MNPLKEIHFDDTSTRSCPGPETKSSDAPAECLHCWSATCAGCLTRSPETTGEEEVTSSYVQV